MTAPAHTPRSPYLLACRCGKPLQPAELRWLPQREGDRHPLPRVGCADCAARTRAW